MKILALTHAHLNIEGLSPVSCERADSLVSAWTERLHWQVDVVYTKGSKWRGIWPNGKGLKINILEEAAPDSLMMGVPELFSKTIKEKLAKKEYAGVASLITGRISKRLRTSLAAHGFALPHQLAVGKKWGQYLSALNNISSKRYDYIFVCVGYGDEYLLQTGLVLSRRLGVPMFVDFRDVWSDHHDPDRFTEKQRKQVRKYELELLATTRLISAPQKHYISLLNKWTSVPLYHFPHSAYVGSDWEDGRVISDEYRILYAGKLYPNGPGIKMLLQLIQQLSQSNLPKPFKCHFYVDEPDTLRQLAADYGVSDCIIINGWVAPSQLWKETRSAHLLVIIDSATEENYPMLLTKTFQYAYSGRQILALQKYENEEMKGFLRDNNAGAVFTDTGKACDWVVAQAATNNQYLSIPPLRDIAQREDVAEAYGKRIEELHRTHSK